MDHLITQSCWPLQIGGFAHAFLKKQSKDKKQQMSSDKRTINTAQKRETANLPGIEGRLQTSATLS